MRTTRRTRDLIFTATRNHCGKTFAEEIIAEEITATNNHSDKKSPRQEITATRTHRDKKSLREIIIANAGNFTISCRGDYQIPGKS